jgi:hypothetical protein
MVHLLSVHTMNYGQFSAAFCVRRAAPASAYSAFFLQGRPDRDATRRNDAGIADPTQHNAQPPLTPKVRNDAGTI